jgi:hypothetical protein
MPLTRLHGFVLRHRVNLLIWQLKRSSMMKVEHGEGRRKGRIVKDITYRDVRSGIIMKEEMRTSRK